MAAKDELNMGELAAAVVAADPEIRNELKGLVQDIIRHMRYTMRHGEASSKLQLARAITPQLLSAINKVNESEGQAAQKAAYERMMGALRGEYVPEDAPT